MFFKNNLTKSCRDFMLKLTGCEIWPPTHGDPRIKGPQPRIISKRQKEWLEKLQRENPSDGVDTVDNGDGDKSKIQLKREQ